MSGSIYLNRIAASTSSSSSLPGGGIITTGKVASYDDVKRVIDEAIQVANQNLTSPSVYNVAYASHILSALNGARDAVRRAVAAAAAAYHGTGIGAAMAHLDAFVVAADKPVEIYRRAIGNAITLRQVVVALPVFAQAASDADGLLEGVVEALIADGMPPAHDFRGTVTWYLGALKDVITGLQAYEAWAVFLGSGGLLGFIADAVGLVIDALKGVWGIAHALVASLGFIAELVPVALIGGAVAGGYYLLGGFGDAGGRRPSRS